jgi:hypothetical protein
MKKPQIAPRIPEKARDLFRGSVLPLSQTALSLLNAETLPQGESTYKSSAAGIHTTSDIKTARLYADASSFIEQQKNPHTSRDQSNWTVGVVHRLDNSDNKLAAKVAKPKGPLAKFEKVLSHHILGRTEFIIPEILGGSATVREIYLFRRHFACYLYRQRNRPNGASGTFEIFGSSRRRSTHRATGGR